MTEKSRNLVLKLFLAHFGRSADTGKASHFSINVDQIDLPCLSFKKSFYGFLRIFRDTKGFSESVSTAESYDAETDFVGSSAVDDTLNDMSDSSISTRGHYDFTLQTLFSGCFYDFFLFRIDINDLTRHVFLYFFPESLPSLPLVAGCSGVDNADGLLRGKSVFIHFGHGITTYSISLCLSQKMPFFD